MFIYFISQESLAKRADMPAIFIYNHCIEKSPPTLSIKVVFGFPLGVQKTNANSMTQRRWKGGFSGYTGALWRLSCFQFSYPKFCSIYFVLQRLENTLPPLKEEPRLKR